MGSTHVFLDTFVAQLCLLLNVENSQRVLGECKEKKDGGGQSQ